MTDIPGSTATTASITVGGTVTGSLETVGDHDWYRLSLTAGQTVTITLSGTGASAGMDTYLRVRGSDGTELAANDDSGNTLSSRLGFTAPSTGTFYVDVGTWNDSQSGQFQLSVATYTPPPLYDYNQIANQLVNGFWATDGGARHFNVSPGGSLTVNVTALTSAGQTLAREALSLWTDVIGVTFRAVTTGGQIVFDDSESGAFSSSAFVNGIISSSHVNVGLDWLSSYGTSLNGYAFQSYIHEIGHALGLGHAGNYNGDANYLSDALFRNDAWSTTIMSYFSQSDNNYFQQLGFTNQFVLTPMNGDIVAMSTMYGLSTTTRTGNTIYGFGSTAGRAVFNASLYPAAAYTITDSGGTDTLNYSGYGAAQRIDLNPEVFSNVGGHVGNVMIARGTIIENATGGSGVDTIIGNSANNILNGNAGDDSLTGNGGNDSLDGGTGADLLAGGPGNDTYFVDNIGDRIVEISTGGTDAVKSSVSYTLPNNVESMVLLGTAAINATGNALANTLVGNSAANVLNGAAGADTLKGGAGNDTYFVDNIGDRIVEGAGAGADAVKSSVSYALAANVESMVLIGTAAINGTGNGLDNTIVGNSAANILNGAAGADILKGGAGDDRYVVDNAGDRAVEGVGAGTDLVTSSVTFRLSNNIENLDLVGASAINGAGNGLDNMISGNSAANLLEGGGGRDELFGGGDRDQFVFRDGDFAGLTATTCDEILDFNHAQGDKVRLDLVDANSLLAGQQDFAFIGTETFHHVAGELRYQEVSGNTFIYGDTNGDGIADFMILVDGSHAFTRADFIL